MIGTLSIYLSLFFLSQSVFTSIVSDISISNNQNRSVVIYMSLSISIFLFYHIRLINKEESAVSFSWPLAPRFQYDLRKHSFPVPLHWDTSEKLSSLLPRIHELKRRTRLTARSEHFRVKITKCKRKSYANSSFSHTYPSLSSGVMLSSQLQWFKI